MKFAIYKTSRLALKKAGSAVLKKWQMGGGFTLLEVMVVVIIIGILATLAYSSLIELIYTNRAKEVAQTIRTFAERALIDAKRQHMVVRICIDKNEIISENPKEPNETFNCGEGKRISSEAFSNSYKAETSPPISDKKDFENKVKTEVRIGLSGIVDEGYFAACDPRGYCGGAVKVKDDNSLRAYIKRGKNSDWGAL